MKKKEFSKKGGPVTFNRDITAEESGVKKSGVAHPNIEQGAAAVKGSKRPMGRAKKRSSKKRD